MLAPLLDDVSCDLVYVNHARSIEVYSHSKTSHAPPSPGEVLQAVAALDPLDTPSSGRLAQAGRRAPR